jgi:hypothetical protein
VIIAGGDLNDGAAHIDITGARRRFIIANLVRVGISELPGIASAPTADFARVEQGARVITAGGETHDRPADIDIPHARGELVITDIARHVRVAELSASLAPTANLVVGEQRATMIFASDHAYDDSAHFHVACARRRLGVPDGIGIPVAKLSVSTISPAAHLGGIEKSASVINTAIELNYGRADIDVPGARGSFIVTNILGGRVPELPAVTFAPTANISRVADGTGVAVPHAHGLPRRTPRRAFKATTAVRIRAAVHRATVARPIA